MPQVTIYGPSPKKDTISPLRAQSWDQDIRDLGNGVVVVSNVVDGLTYSATVTGADVATIRGALSEQVPVGWTLSVV